MDPRMRHAAPIERRIRGPVTERVNGPVIDRASEPGIPRGIVRLFVFALIAGAAYMLGYWPDAGRIERGWNDIVVAVQEFWDPPAPPPPARPVQTARPAPTAAPPPRAAPPPISAPSARPNPPPFAVPPLPQPDPFAEAFRRDVIGQISPPGASPPAPPRAPISREAPPPPPAAPSPPAAGDAPSSPSVASAPPATPPVPAPQPAQPERTSVFARPPGATPASPFAADTLDRFVEKELNTFNASREIPAKRAAMQRIVAAAQLGHGPSRGVIVRGFPASTIIRDVIAPSDAVRFSLDFVVHKRAYSNDARRDFQALAAWFDAERKDAAFGEAVFDAIRDDARLQSPEVMNDLMYLLYRVDRGCAALRRHIDVFDPNTQTIGHCGRDLAVATPQKAKEAGVQGGEARGFREAVEILRKAAPGEL